MRAMILIFLLAGCGTRPLTAEEIISIIDGQCREELYLAGECDKPPIAGTRIVDKVKRGQSARKRRSAP